MCNGHQHFLFLFEDSPLPDSPQQQRCHCFDRCSSGASSIPESLSPNAVSKEFDWVEISLATCRISLVWSVIRHCKLRNIIHPHSNWTISSFQSSLSLPPKQRLSCAGDRLHISAGRRSRSSSRVRLFNFVFGSLSAWHALYRRLASSSCLFL